jgi:TPR repeat protein
MKKANRSPTKASDLPALKAKADAGDAEAQHELGRIFSLGEIVPPDKTESMKWYRKAADQGHAKAQVEIGEMYFDGIGVKQDGAEGLKWLLKAAEQGNGHAPLRLYDRYWRGVGVKQDYAEAYFWASVGFAELNGLFKNNNKDFYEKVAALGGLTSEKKAAIDKRVEEWKKAHPAPLPKP